jgi:hypothetical protein
VRLREKERERDKERKQSKMNETIKIYEPLWIVKLFHSFPHLNMWFQQVNSTFNPLNMENNEYIEVSLFNHF